MTKKLTAEEKIAKTIEYCEYSRDIAFDNGCNVCFQIEIDYKTIGQYTGMLDKNGIKIFEGDIVDFSDRSDGDGYGVVRYDENETEFEFESDNICRSLGSYYPKNIEVIGNIYDNPEFLPEFLKEVQNYDKEINGRR